MSTSTAAPPQGTSPEVERLQAEVARLRKVNGALMDRVERDMDLTGGAYTVFQAATVLEQKVRERTEAVERAKRSLLKANQALTVAKEDAESALRTKDQFLASMSHELRTPLNAILGASESLIEGVQGPVTPQQAASLRIVESSGRHLLDLINDVLDVARVGAGEMQLHLEQVWAQSVAEASLNIVSGAADKRGISLALDDARARGLCITADERRLKQILVNLLGNAIKFTEPGGHVELTVAASADGDWVRFSVADNGMGIAEGDQDQLFKPFVQADSTLGRRFEGTGLGLSLVDSMTRMHGGTVELKSTLGVGSTFTVSFPRDPALPECDGPPPATPSVNAEKVAAASVGRAATRDADDDPRGGHRVMLVEDNQANIDVIAPYLEAKGYQVVVAMGGAESVELAASEEPDLILMDIQMPGVDGLEAIRRIRSAEGHGRNVPIVALTALAMPGDRERCLDAGADDHVTKPVRLRALGDRMREMLAGGRADP